MLKKTTLLLTLLFHYIHSQTCGVPDPLSLSDCYPSSSKNNYCCYVDVKLSQRKESLCLFIPKNQIYITPYLNHIDIGIEDETLEFHVDCGYNKSLLKKGEPYSECGVPFPTKAEQCFNDSLVNLSCCFLKNPKGNATCLYNIGIIKRNESYFGINIICAGEIRRVSVIRILILMIALLV